MFLNLFYDFYNAALHAESGSNNTTTHIIIMTALALSGISFHYFTIKQGQFKVILTYRTNLSRPNQTFRLQSLVYNIIP